VTGGGGSSEARPFEPVSILTGIANLLGPNVHVLYSRGLPEMNDVFGIPLGRRQGGHLPQQGLHRHAGDATLQIADWKARRSWGPGTTSAQHPLHRRYKAAKAGKYLLLAPPPGKTPSRCWSTARDCGPAPRRGPGSAFWTLDLTAGQTVNVVADYLPHASRRPFRPGNRL
jgi:hypothetical protein